MSVVKFGYVFLLCMGVITLSKAVIPDDSELMDSGDDPDDDNIFDISGKKNVLFDGKTSNENANTLELRLTRQRTANFAAVSVNRTCCVTFDPNRCRKCSPAEDGPVCSTCTGGMSCGSCGPFDLLNLPVCVIYCQCCCSSGVDGSCKQCDCGTAGCSVALPGTQPPTSALARQCQPTQTCQCFRHAGNCQAACNPTSPIVLEVIRF